MMLCKYLPLFNFSISLTILFSQLEQSQRRAAQKKQKKQKKPKVRAAEQPVLRRKPVNLRDMTESVVIENLGYCELNLHFNNTSYFYMSLSLM